MTRTQTLAPTCPPPPVSALLAAWSQSGGTYQDGTSQPSRYSVLNTVVTDALTGMQWQQTASTSPMNWTTAAMYCSLQTTGGLSGWRLPTIKELSTLVDYSVTQGTLMMDAAAFAGEPVNWYWSSTAVVGGPSLAWVVGFRNGYVNFDGGVSPNHTGT